MRRPCRSLGLFVSDYPNDRQLEVDDPASSTYG